MAASPQGASGGKGDAAAGDAEVMDKAELKQLLMMAKRRPVSCAIAVTKEGQAVVLLDKRVKPKKLVAELKRTAKEKSIELEIATLRFGRAAVDENSSVQFTVNKESPGALRMKVLERLKPAGFPKCQIGVDEKLESEGDDDEPGAAGHPAGGDMGGAASQGGAAHVGAGATGGGETGGGETGGGETGGGETGGGETGGVAAHAGAGDAGGGTAAAPTGGTGGNGQTPPGAGAADTDAAGPSGAATGDKGGLKDRMRGLLEKIGSAIGSNPAIKAGLLTMARAAMDAMKSGDMAGAAKAADTLEKALGGSAADTGPAQTADGTAGAGAVGSTAGGSTAAGPTAAGPSAAGNTPSGRPLAGANTGPTPPPVAANSQTTPAGAGGQQRGQHGSPVFDKARQTWDAVRAKVQRDIDTVVKAFEGELGKGSEDAKMIHACFEPILKGLDDSLSKKLDEVVKNTDQGAHGKLVQEAQALITKYTAYIDGEPMVAELDSNPAHPVTVRKTLDAALATLSKALGASGQAVQPAARAA